MQIVNISAYKFVTLEDRETLRPALLAECQARELKGTVLLAPEGINIFLAGTREAIDGIVGWLRADPRFADLNPKESLSDHQPFRRLLVRLKKEIITMRHPLIRPEDGRAPSVSPADLKRWLDQGHDDEGRPVVMLDTRNGFEVAVGTFRNAVDYGITKFTEFPRPLPPTRTTSQARPSCRSAPAASAAKRRRSTCRRSASNGCTSSKAAS